MNTNNIYFSANHYTFNDESVAWLILDDVVAAGGSGDLDSKYKDSSSIPIYGRAYRLAQRKGVKTLVDYKLIQKCDGLYKVTPIGKEYHAKFSSLVERNPRVENTGDDLRQEKSNMLLSVAHGCSSVDLFHYKNLDYVECEILKLFAGGETLSLSSIHDEVARTLFHVQPGSFDYFVNKNKSLKKFKLSADHDKADFDLNNLMGYVYKLVDEGYLQKAFGGDLCLTNRGRAEIDEGVYFDSYDEQGVLQCRGLYNDGKKIAGSFFEYSIKEFAKKNPDALPIQAAVFFYNTSYQNCDILSCFMESC